jgi:hypothetical protein
MIKSKSANELEKFAVVDVRDSDFVVGQTSLRSTRS